MKEFDERIPKFEFSVRMVIQEMFDAGLPVIIHYRGDDWPGYHSVHLEGMEDISGVAIGDRDIVINGLQRMKREGLLRKPLFDQLETDDERRLASRLFADPVSSS